MTTRNLARRAARRGFTLMELLVVVAILLVLAGTSFIAYTTIFAEAKTSIARTECVKLAGALQNYSMVPSNLGNYPDPTTGFTELLLKGIISKEPSDPWNQPYRWMLVPRGIEGDMKPMVWSSGPNMIDEQGGGDDITSE